MKIFPAIDLKNGKCVRLTKGDFTKMKIYSENPIRQAEIFFKEGFTNLHIVDLDGALTGNLVNLGVIKKIIKNYNMKIEIGGGIRTDESISKLIDIGADKVILGTAAIKDKFFLEKACKKYLGKIALAIDVRFNKIALSGWKEQTKIDATEFLNSIKNIGLSRVIYTDINRDGTGFGSNLKESYEVAEKIKIPLIISGGISSLQEVKQIFEEKSNYIEGVIVGKAIYDNKINLKELKKII
tara:strand:- start:3977 stop:4696 length:720 start_codon:yes stop_codon:yes gene_type:complete